MRFIIAVAFFFYIIPCMKSIFISQLDYNRKSCCFYDSIKTKPLKYIKEEEQISRS